MPRARFLWVLAAMAPAIAQTQPGPDFDAAEKRAIEWSVLTGNLEQRLARLLPCDARVRAAIDEVSRASEARVAALTAHWQAVAASQEELDSTRSMLARQEAATGREDAADAAAGSAAVSGRAAQLAASARSSAPLLEAKNVLDRIAAASEQAAVSESMLAALRENLAANETRRRASEGAVKALEEEGQRWRAYYTARASRAQTECAITEGPAAPPARAFPNPAPAKKSSPKETRP